MGWETRNGASYYYQKRREGGRVVSRYVGSGAHANFVAMMDAQEQAEQVLEDAAIRAERARHEAMDARLDELGEMVEALTTAALLAAGYHTHKRQWRIQRHG
jgi:hypothetical protein